MDIRYYIVRPDDDIQRVIKVIDNNRDGIALVVNKAGSLVGTITDGDIRRFMLSGCSSDELCGNVMNDKPLTAGTSASRKELINLIKQHRIRNIPLVDKDGRPVKVVNITDLINDKEPDFIAVVMAGGEGKRLRPLTEKLPKPMIRVGDSPLLEQIIRNLKRSGILNIFISVNYQADVIESCFKDGAEFGVKIQYLREGKKLGTAGALSMLTDIIDLPSQPILVMNGDIMTSVNLERFLEFHKQHRCSMSLAAYNTNRWNIRYTETGLPGKPKAIPLAPDANVIGLPGLTAKLLKCSFRPACVIASATKSKSPTDTPPVPIPMPVDKKVTGMRIWPRRPSRSLRYAFTPAPNAIENFQLSSTPFRSIM